MNYLIVAFRSRNYLFEFVSFMRSIGINMQVINTPRYISVSCGLSAKTSAENLNIVKSTLKRTGAPGLTGIFLVSNLYGNEKFERLY